MRSSTFFKITPYPSGESDFLILHVKSSYVLSQLNGTPHKDQVTYIQHEAFPDQNNQTSNNLNA